MKRKVDYMKPSGVKKIAIKDRTYIARYNTAKFGYLKIPTFINSLRSK